VENKGKEKNLFHGIGERGKANKTSPFTVKTIQ